MMKATLPDWFHSDTLTYSVKSTCSVHLKMAVLFPQATPQATTIALSFHPSFRDNWKVSVSVGTFKAAVDLLSLTTGVNALVYKGTNLKSNQMDIYRDSSLCKDKHAEKLSFSHVGPNDL